ncbi:MAG: glycosyltransferase [Candidatus Paceibacterota bacterium]|jgi:glycosyltransferase involved in cell wall biosynthesis
MESVKKNIKIVLAINDLGFGGGQRTLVMEANEFLKMGVDVFVVTTLAGGKEDFLDLLKLEKNRIFRANIRSYFDFIRFFKLVRLLKDINADFVISNLFFTNLFIRASKFFGVKSKIFVREGNTMSFRGAFSILVDRLMSFVTTGYIANSFFVKDQLMKTLKLYFKDVAVVYNGIYNTFFLPENRKTNYHFSGCLNIVSVASVTRKKNQVIVLDAIKILKEKEVNVTLTIFGVGSEVNNLLSRAKLLGVEENLFIKPPRSDTESFLKNFDVFILTSLWEGMPNSMLEAMAVGLPVVAPDCGWSREIFKEGINGLPIKEMTSDGVASALEILFNDDGLRKELGDNGRNFVADWKWDAHARKILNLLK